MLVRIWNLRKQESTSGRFLLYNTFKMLRLLNMMRLLIRGEYGELRGMIFQIFPGHRRLVQWLYSLAGNRIGMSIGSFGLKLFGDRMMLGCYGKFLYGGFATSGRNRI